MIIIIILAGFRRKKDRTRARRHFCRFSRLVEDLDFLDVVHFVSDPHGPLLRSRCNISYVHTHIYIYICIREPKVFVNRYLRTEMFRKNVFSLFVIYLTRDYFEFESCLKSFFFISIEKIDEYRM